MITQKQIDTRDAFIEYVKKNVDVSFWLWHDEAFKRLYKSIKIADKEAEELQWLS